MKTTFNKFLDTMTAAAFAEAGEWDTAIEMLPSSRPQRILSWLDRQMMAITYAESGLFDEAVRISESEQSVQKKADIFTELRSHGIHLAYGYAHVEA